MCCRLILVLIHPHLQPSLSPNQITFLIHTFHNAFLTYLNTPYTPYPIQVINTAFTGTPCRVSGMTFDDIAAENVDFARKVIWS